MDSEAYPHLDQSGDILHGLKMMNWSFTGTNGIATGGSDHRDALMRRNDTEFQQDGDVEVKQDDNTPFKE